MIERTKISCSIIPPKPRVLTEGDILLFGTVEEFFMIVRVGEEDDDLTIISLTSGNRWNDNSFAEQLKNLEETIGKARVAKTAKVEVYF